MAGVNATEKDSRCFLKKEFFFTLNKKSSFGTLATTHTTDF